MTPKATLDRLRELEQQATAGPWRARDVALNQSALGKEHGLGRGVQTVVETEWDHPQAKEPLQIMRTLIGPYQIPRAFTHIDRPNAELHASMRNALPQLLQDSVTLAQLRALRDVAEVVRGQCPQCGGAGAYVENNLWDQCRHEPCVLANAVLRLIQ